LISRCVKEAVKTKTKQLFKNTIMKKLLTTIALIGLFSYQSNAADLRHGEKTSPWETFKTVVDTYQNASGQFLNLSNVEQAEFINAAEKIKSRLSNHSDEMSVERLKRIDVAVNVFRFIWESKPAEIPMDADFEIPAAPAII
jgi:hypothetical protein